MNMQKISLLFFFLFIIPINALAKNNLTIMPISTPSWGDSTLIESNGEYLLMDVTASDSSNPNEVIEFLIKNNVTKFDIYLSHYHYDHYGYYFVDPNGEKVNLIEYLLLNENLGGYKNYLYDIGTLYLPDVLSKSEYCESMTNKCESLNKIEQGFLSAAEKNNIEVKKLNVGDVFTIGSTTAKVLHLETDSSLIKNLGMDEGTFINNSSLVTMFTNGTIKFLTAGDIQDYTENKILELGIDISADIYKLNHHALQTSSEISNTKNFVEKVRPKYSYFQFINKDAMNSTYSYTYDSISSSVNNLSGFSNLYTNQLNGNIKFVVENNNIIPEVEKNTHSITINYVDAESNNILDKVVYSFNYDLYNNPVNYYLYNLERKYEGYAYSQSEVPSSQEVLNEDKVYNIYYTKIQIEDDKEKDDETVVQVPSTASTISIIIYIFISIMLIFGSWLIYYIYNQKNITNS